MVRPARDAERVDDRAEVRAARFDFHWKVFHPKPEMFNPKGQEIPLFVQDFIPYYRDKENVSLKFAYRGDDAVPAPVCGVDDACRGAARGKRRG